MMDFPRACWLTYYHRLEANQNGIVDKTNVDFDNNEVLTDTN